MSDPQSTTLTIHPVAGIRNVFAHYDGQAGPQDVFIALDIRSGDVWASYSGEIGNAIPMNVYHGLVRRWYIPPMLPDDINTLMEELRPQLERVLAGATVEWNGSNNVGKLSEDAETASNEIEIACTDQPATLHYMDTGDWLAQVRANIERQLRDGVSIDDLAEEYRGAETGEEVGEPILIGETVREYLENLAEYLDDEEED